MKLDSSLCLSSRAPTRRWETETRGSSKAHRPASLLVVTIDPATNKGEGEDQPWRFTSDLHMCMVAQSHTHTLRTVFKKYLKIKFNMASRNKQTVGEGAFIFCDKLVDFSLRAERPCVENKMPDV